MSNRDDDNQPPPDWCGNVLELFSHPDIDPADRACPRKLVGWRAPGADGVARLRTIAEKVDVR